jgi:hypothetical protein
MGPEGYLALGPHLSTPGAAHDDFCVATFGQPWKGISSVNAGWMFCDTLGLSQQPPLRALARDVARSTAYLSLCRYARCTEC